MKKINLILAGICFSAIAFSQPYNYIQTINPADTSLISSPDRRIWEMKKTPEPIVIDGNIDSIWDYVAAKDIDRYIMCRTAYEGGVYSCKPLTDSRTPNNADDFSGTFKLTYDDDFLYILYNINDNEINDGVINPGIQERIEILEAPYSDSAQQLLQEKPYPPFSGSAPELNKKFCYWAYLGAFKMNFFLNSEPSVTIIFDERADATKINYPQRVSSCDAKWKRRNDGSGYVMEAAISLKVALADSANNPFILNSPDEVQFMAFDMLMYDKDNGQNQITATWNAQDACVWDNMLYSGKLRFIEHMCAYMLKCGDWPPIWDPHAINNSKVENITFSPNPASEAITFSQKITKAEIYSITGVLMKSEQNTEQINVSDLPQGLFIVKVDGMVIGKMVKE